MEIEAKEKGIAGHPREAEVCETSEFNLPQWFRACGGGAREEGGPEDR